MAGPSTLLVTSLCAAGVFAAGCSSTQPPDTSGANPPYTTTPGSSGADASNASDSNGPGQGEAPDAAQEDAAASDTGPSSGDGATTTSDATAAVDGPSGDASPTVPADAGPPRCDPSHAWLELGELPSVPQANFGRLAGVSPDELTIAWTSPAGAIYVADRSVRNSAFGTATVLDTSSVALADDRAALSPNRVEIVAVAADRRGFVSFTRSSVDAGPAWAPSTAAPFANVSAMIAADSAGAFSAPVLGGDRISFFYLLALSGAPSQLFESIWDPANDAWTTGVALPNIEFASNDPYYVTYATGASSDGLTLFFVAGALHEQRAAWRDTNASPFSRFVTLTSTGAEGGTPGSLAEATPNARCDTLYFQRPDSAGINGAYIAQ